MKRIAVLLTCFNRKTKTLACLRQMYAAYEPHRKEFGISVYLTDDGCTDGTVDAVYREFADKNIRILKGTGTLYWAGGMRNSWNESLKGYYDGYLLLNDDTLVSNNVFSEIMNTHLFSIKYLNTGGIYIGTTSSPENKSEITYGGSVIMSRWKHKTKLVMPNGKSPQFCDLANANIMFVSAHAVQRIGILNDTYTHVLADYDYTLAARKKGIPVLITSNFCGICENDHPYDINTFVNKSLIERIKFTYSPLGFAFTNYLEYYRRNFWYRVPIVFLGGWVKIFFPQMYKSINN